MANIARMNAELQDKDLDKATHAVISYLGGKEQTPQQAAATEAFLNSLPQDKVEQLKSLSQKANYSVPKLEPGVMYGIWIDHTRIARDRQEAEDKLKQAIEKLSQNDPSVKEKLLDVIDVSKDVVRPSPVIQTPMRDLLKAPADLAVQQQQAYLKLLKYDIGASGLDGIAGKDSKTQKALEEFARKNNIDPKDVSQINEALLKAVKGTDASKAFLSRMESEIASGKASRDDIKTMQWVLKGNNAELPLSQKGKNMDGIAGAETRTQLKKLQEDISPSSMVQRFIDALPAEEVKLIEENAKRIQERRGGRYTQPLDEEPDTPLIKCDVDCGAAFESAAQPPQDLERDPEAPEIPVAEVKRTLAVDNTRGLGR